MLFSQQARKDSLGSATEVLSHALIQSNFAPMSAQNDYGDMVPRTTPGRAVPAAANRRQGEGENRSISQPSRSHLAERSQQQAPIWPAHARHGSCLLRVETFRWAQYLPTSRAYRTLWRRELRLPAFRRPTVSSFSCRFALRRARSSPDHLRTPLGRRRSACSTTPSSAATNGFAIFLRPTPPSTRSTTRWAM